MDVAMHYRRLGFSATTITGAVLPDEELRVMRIGQLKDVLDIFKDLVELSLKFLGKTGIGHDMGFRDDEDISLDKLAQANHDEEVVRFVVDEQGPCPSREEEEKVEAKDTEGETPINIDIEF